LILRRKDRKKYIEYSSFYLAPVVSFAFNPVKQRIKKNLGNNIQGEDSIWVITIP
jgi:hypothetical protein